MINNFLMRTQHNHSKANINTFSDRLYEKYMINNYYIIYIKDYYVFMYYSTYSSDKDFFKRAYYNLSMVVK